MGPFSGEYLRPGYRPARSLGPPQSGSRFSTAGEALGTGSDGVRLPSGVLGQASNRSQNVLPRAPTQRFPAAPTRPCQRSPRLASAPTYPSQLATPLVRERVGPDPEVSHRAQEGQGCADHDVSGRRRAAEAPRVAQKPCTSLTIALTDTAASGPEPQRRPNAYALQRISASMRCV